MIISLRSFPKVKHEASKFSLIRKIGLKSQVLKKWSHDSEALSSEKWSDFQEACCEAAGTTQVSTMLL